VATVTSLRTPVRTLLRARALMMAGVPEREVQQRLKLGQCTVECLPLTETQLPHQRCPECGGKVVMPCRKCAIEGKG